jgi:hypothetical protein
LRSSLGLGQLGYAPHRTFAIVVVVVVAVAMVESSCRSGTALGTAGHAMQLPPFTDG